MQTETKISELIVHMDVGGNLIKSNAACVNKSN